MNDVDYEALREHLQEVRPICDDFCDKNGFEYVPRLSIGRYARIRIARERLTNIYFDLWMDFDENAQHFETFRRERFCQEYGYEEQTTALGRYPRRYIRREGEVDLFFDLQMDLDEEGEYFHQFNPSLPYSMGAGGGLILNRCAMESYLNVFRKCLFLMSKSGCGTISLRVIAR